MSNFIGIERLTYGPWQAFERAILRFFVHSGFQDCRLVGGPGDKGADVLGVKNGKLFVAQAKYRKNALSLDIACVEEVVQAINSYSPDEAVVVSNQFFQQDAYDAANKYSSTTGIPVRLWPGNILLGWSKKLPNFAVIRNEMRSYQEEAVEAVEYARSQGKQRALVAMATGLGKTRVAGEVIIREILYHRGTEVLVLAHTVDLVHQFETALWEVLPKDVSTHIWAGGESPAYAGGVTCATMQSIIEAAKRTDLVGRYSLVIVDEAHHAPADGYRELLELLEPRFLLGMTATPWRSDERLLSDMFGPAVYTMSVVEGMQRGYLANIDYRMLVDDIDWQQVPQLTKQGLTIAELNRKLFIPQRDESIVTKLIEHIESLVNCRCIIFCRTIEHARNIYRLSRAAGHACRLIHSGLSRIESVGTLRDFRSGKTSVLISVDMLNEGIDIPDVNLVVFLRVTHSRRIFVQQLGRGLRIRGDKSTVRVLDFVADIRRIAAGVKMNIEAENIAKHKSGEKESLRFPNGKIIQFSNDEALRYFNEYLKDVSELEDFGEDATLKFPPPLTSIDD